MKFDFYNAKQELLKIAAQLFTYEMKELEGDVEIGKLFDCITYKIYGAASFSPKEQMEKENLEYALNDQGRDFLSSFLTLVIQSGVKLGHLEKEIEIEGLKSDRDYQKESKEHYREEWSKAKDELRHHRMPEGKLEDEIVSLRKQLDEEKLKNAKLSRYKDMVDKVVQSEKFLRENDSDS
jgi:ERCC4-related helicase